MTKKTENTTDDAVDALDETLAELGYDDDQQVRVLQRSDGREVVLIQANPFSLSRLYATGRPDGELIQGWDSHFAMIDARLKEYRDQHGTDMGFKIEEDEWDAIFEEARDRYVRYLFFSGIQRWEDVERDTAANMTVCDWAKRYADEETAWRVYQFKGYIIMMNAIARAELAFGNENIEDAQNQIAQGIEQIGAYCKECLLLGHPDAEQITRDHYLANILKYREEAVIDGRLPDVQREDPSNVV